MKTFSNIIFFCFLIFFILPSSSDYVLPDKYFINCGSTQTASGNGQNFIGDESSGNVTFSDSHVTNVSATLPLYQTSRIFKLSSNYYEFVIDKYGTYILRLHFYPTSNSSENLFNASFNVSASGKLLLANFSVDKSAQLPKIQEFFLHIEVGKFKVIFKPVQESSFAFITALELFLAPDNIVPGSAPNISPSGKKEPNYRLPGELHVIHRLNVGGGTLTSYNNDSLGRLWIRDNDFMPLGINGKSVSRTGGILRYQPPGASSYQPQGATKDDAPNLVYNTAKALYSNLNNLTWSFNLSKNVSYLVRVHFCDIISNSTSKNTFNLYIYSDYAEKITGASEELAAPCHYDYVVGTDDSGSMDIRIGQDESQKPAFLNGVEIMELIVDRESSSGSKKKVVVIVGSVIGGSIVIIIFVVVLICVLRRGKKKNYNQSVQSQLVGVIGGHSSIETTQRTSNHSPHFNLDLRLSFSDIVHATDNFNPKLIIGEGGFGKVYSGVLNGGKVAVKRSETGHGQGLIEFHTEINVLSRLRHRHLVPFIGYCDEGAEMILVYEFMEKGTLREHLYERVSNGNYQTSQSQLSWEKRLEICIGAANGLHYLHACLDESFIHRDVKSTNILLDADFTAKISDFGLSKLGPHDQTHVITQLKGSFGYYDPEYFTYMQLTQKSDVYSFGVVLVEVLCARPVIITNTNTSSEQVNLSDWALDRLRKGLLESIIDPLLVGKINPNSLRKYGETFEKCLQESGADRPSMLDVCWNLEYALRLQRPNRIISGQNGDSTTDVSVNLPSMVLNHLPSYSTQFRDIALPEGSEDMDSNNIDASQVFSQLKMNEAR